jgi:hypothetical protein
MLVNVRAMLLASLVFPRLLYWFVSFFFLVLFEHLHLCYCSSFSRLPSSSSRAITGTLLAPSVSGPP